jgi:hypothetical protein
MAGRKPLPERTMLIRASLTLRAGEDDDLIKAFQSVPARKRAAFIKAAMRSGSFQGISYDDLPSDEELEQSIANFLE